MKSLRCARLNPLRNSIKADSSFFCMERLMRAGLDTDSQCKVNLGENLKEMQT